MKRRIWFDVTDFLQWKGNFTGLQHVQYHMAKLYLADKRDIKFFVYQQGTHKFIEVAFDPDAVSANGIRLEEETPEIVLSKSLLHVAKRLTPPPVKRIVKKIVVRKQYAPLPHGTDSPFQKDDVVLVLGGIWHGTFAEDLQHEKKKYGFMLVHVVHDMIPVQVPQYVVEDLPAVFAAYKEKVFRMANGLVINSKSSKNDAEHFMKAHNIVPPPSVVFRLADEPADTKAEKAVAGLKPGSFALMLGTVEARKNPVLMYYTYKHALREGIKLPKLVIAGRLGWLVDDFLYMVRRDPELRGQVVVLEGVSNAERAWLFRHCIFTVWPSFYEGWGMPVAESLAYGKLCLSSDQSSMPEIGGKLVEYFSPYNPAQLAELMHAYSDAKVRAKKEAEIRKNYKPTTWADMYKQISGFIDSF